MRWNLNGNSSLLTPDEQARVLSAPEGVAFMTRAGWLGGDGRGNLYCGDRIVATWGTPVAPVAAPAAAAPPAAPNYAEQTYPHNIELNPQPEYPPEHYAAQHTAQQLDARNARNARIRARARGQLAPAAPAPAPAPAPRPVQQQAAAASPTRHGQELTGELCEYALETLLAQGVQRLTGTMPSQLTLRSSLARVMAKATITATETE